MEIRIKLRHKDKHSELFGVFVTDHPKAPRPALRRVAYVEPKGQNVCFIAQHDLEESEQKAVVEFVKEWQADEEAIAASRQDKEATF